MFERDNSCSQFRFHLRFCEDSLFVCRTLDLGSPVPDQQLPEGERPNERNQEECGWQEQAIYDFPGHLAAKYCPPIPPG